MPPMTEEDRIRRRQNAEAYDNLSQADKLSRIRSVTGKVPEPNQQQIMSPAPPKDSAVPAPPKEPASMAPTNTAPTEYQSWKAKQDELFKKLEGLTNQPFTYNPETDPAYQAQRQLAHLRSQDANRATMELQNEKGLLQSSMTNSQLNQNAQRAEQEAAAFIPQYRQQAYGQFQDRLRSAGDLLSAARNLNNDEFDRSTKEADLTGNYVSPEAQGMLQRVIDLGEAWNTGTPEQKAAYSQEADQLRAELTGMGIDASLFGADKTTEERMANVGRAGVRTIAGQTLDNQQAQQEWSNLFNQAQFDENKAARIWEQTFKEKSFEQDMREAAASRGLQWANLSQRDKEFIADDAFREKQFNYEKEQDKLAREDAENQPEKPTNNEIESEYISQLDSLTPEQLTDVFTNQKAAIVKDLGLSGYNTLYKQYFDEYGRPLKK